MHSSSARLVGHDTEVVLLGTVPSLEALLSLHLSAVHVINRRAVVLCDINMRATALWRQLVVLQVKSSNAQPCRAAPPRAARSARHAAPCNALQAPPVKPATEPPSVETPAQQPQQPRSSQVAHQRPRDVAGAQAAPTVPTSLHEWVAAAQTLLRSVQQQERALPASMQQCSALLAEFVNVHAAQQHTREEQQSAGDGVTALLNAALYDTRTPSSKECLPWQVITALQRIVSKPGVNLSYLRFHRSLQEAVHETLKHLHSIEGFPEAPAAPLVMTPNAHTEYGRLNTHIMRWAQVQERFAVFCVPFWLQLDAVLQQAGENVLDVNAARAVLGAAGRAKQRGEHVPLHLVKQLASRLLYLERYVGRFGRNNGTGCVSHTITLMGLLRPWVGTDVLPSLPHEGKCWVLQAIEVAAPQWDAKRTPQLVRSAGLIIKALAAGQDVAGRLRNARCALVQCADEATGSCSNAALLTTGLADAGAFAAAQRHDSNAAACRVAESLAAAIEQQRVPLRDLQQARDALNSDQVSNAVRQLLQPNLRDALRRFANDSDASSATAAHMHEAVRAPAAQSENKAETIADAVAQQQARSSSGSDGADLVVHAAVHSARSGDEPQRGAAHNAVQASSAAQEAGSTVRQGSGKATVKPLPVLMREVRRRPEKARAATLRALSDPAALSPADAQTMLFTIAELRMRVQDDQARALLDRACTVQDLAPEAILGVWRAIYEVQGSWAKGRQGCMPWLHYAMRSDNVGNLAESIRQLLAATPAAIEQASAKHKSGRIAPELLAAVATSAAVAAPSALHPATLRDVAATYKELHAAIARQAASLPAGSAVKILRAAARLEGALPCGAANAWAAPLMRQTLPLVKSHTLDTLACVAWDLQLNLPLDVLASLAARVLGVVLEFESTSQATQEVWQNGVKAVGTLARLVCMMPEGTQLSVSAAVLSRLAIDYKDADGLAHAAFAFAYAAAQGRGAALPQQGVIGVLDALKRERTLRKDLIVRFLPPR